jgi:hypothetical protein
MNIMCIRPSNKLIITSILWIIVYISINSILLYGYIHYVISSHGRESDLFILFSVLGCMVIMGNIYGIYIEITNILYTYRIYHAIN